MREKKSIDQKMIRENPDTMAPASLTEPPKWEYKIVVFSDIAELNGLGQEGWDLVAVKPRPADQAVYYFRRQIS